MTEEMLELLEGIQDGDYVCVRWGNPQVETEGVIKIGSYSLCIQDDDGEPTKIRLNELSGIAKRKKPENGGKGSISHTASIEQPVAAHKSSPLETSKDDKKSKKEFVQIPPHLPYSFSVPDQISAFKVSMKAACSRKFRNESNRILDGMSDAIKNKNEASKYGPLRQKAIQLWENGCEEEEDYRHFYKLLGILSVSAEAWGNALEPFVRAKCYLPASYAASKLKDQTQEEIFYLCALLNKEAGAALDQWLVDICIRNKDITPFELLSRHYKNNPVLDSCIAEICTSENCLPATGPDLSGSAFVGSCVQALPASWREHSDFRSKWMEFNSYSYPAGAAFHDEGSEETEYSGVIRKFDAGKGDWGFIGEVYFHISQVCDTDDADILLRKLLLGNQGIGLKVRYFLGKSQRPGHIGEAIATDIILDESSLEEAKRRLEAPVTAPKIGYIRFYDEEKGKGTLFSQGRQYRFASEDVRDPYLRAYCSNCLDFVEQEVTFMPTGGGGFPKDICWHDPGAELLESYAEYVSPEQKRAWSKFTETRFKRFPDDRECLRIGFHPLKDLDPAATHSAVPLTWPQSNYTPQGSKQNAGTATASWSSAAAPRAQNAQTNRKSASSRKSFSSRNKHKEMSRSAAQLATVEGRLDDAEKILNQLLQQCSDQEIPQIIGMLISVYLRQPEKTDYAKKLVEQYKDRLPRDKQTNLKITILEKTKDDDEKLCQLYDESIRLASTAAQKAHRLFFMGNVYMRMGKYSLALQSFQRWEKLYAQSRYTQDAIKMQGNVQNVNRQKAICSYHTGHVDEAKKIALDLVRLNPSDTVATAILDDTLDVINNSDYEAQTGDENIFNEDFMDIDSKLPGWIQNQIDNLDLSEATQNIKDGRYVGSLDEAKKDIDRQINRSKVSHSDRCKALLTAYKLQEKTQQAASLTLCGRAIASWGHYMATQPSQKMDTPRMAYLYALQLLPPRDQDWTDSYNAYLKSYFMDRSEFESYILDQFGSGKHERQNTDVFTTHQIRDELFPEFFVGILYFVGKLKGRQFDTVAEGLYRANEKLRDAVCDKLTLILDRQKISSDEQNFKDALRLAYQEVEKQLNNLCRQLQICTEKIFEMPLTDEEMQFFSADRLKYFLTKTDQDRVAAVHDILLGMKGYFSSRDFENRADCLRIGFSKAAELAASIQKEPTDFSYENILSMVDSMILKLTGAQDSLYKDYPPRIILKENGTPHCTEDGGVLVYLQVSNEAWHQAADRIEITVEKGEDVIRLREPFTTPSLRGGEDQDIVLTLDVSERAIREGSFSASVVCRYAYNSEPDKRTDDSMCRESMTFVISSEAFVRISNPFRGYIGVKMDKKEMFFGRDAMIQLLVDKIRDSDGHMSYGRAVAIYGQTRCGKSSLMIHLKNHLEEEFPAQLLVWDMQNIGDSLGNVQMSDFLYKILEIGESALGNHPVLGPIVHSQSIQAPLDEILSGEHSVTLFNSYMRRINKILGENNCIIVLLIDEFSYLHDLIKRQVLPPEFMKFWKAFLQNNKVFALVAGQDDMPEFIAEHQNEFATMDLLMVTYLDEAPAKQLFLEPLKAANPERVRIDPLCADKLFSLTAGSAYLIIILCSALVEYLNEKQTSTISPGIFDDFLKKKVFCDKDSCLEEMYFEPQLKERGHEEYYEENRKILYAIAELSREPGQADVVKIAGRTGIEEARVRELSERLVNRQVIDRETGQKQSCFRIRVKLFEEWLRLKGE